jgi:hypothetical protein
VYCRGQPYCNVVSVFSEEGRVFSTHVSGVLDLNQCLREV